MHLDLEVTNRATGQGSAVELKYLTRLWVGEHDGEQFELKNHGAQDIGGYHVVRDVQRVETFTAAKPGANGAAVVLSNDPYYWKPARGDDATNAAMFRTGDGVVLEGERRWGPNTGPGTLKGNQKPLPLTGRYELHWVPYSRLAGAEMASSRTAPWFDPDSGGVHARVLFLLENPGPQASAERGSGFISIDNNDGSAENFFRLHVEAELPRHRFVNWNVVPWYQAASATSTANATRTDVEDARPWLDRLIHLLPDLRLVITIGAAARDGWMGCWLPTRRSHYRRRSPSHTVHRATS